VRRLHPFIIFIVVTITPTNNKGISVPLSLSSAIIKPSALHLHGGQDTIVASSSSRFPPSSTVHHQPPLN